MYNINEYIYQEGGRMRSKVAAALLLLAFVLTAWFMFHKGPPTENKDSAGTASNITGGTSAGEAGTTDKAVTDSSGGKGAAGSSAVKDGSTGSGAVDKSGGGKDAKSAEGSAINTGEDKTNSDAVEESGSDKPPVAIPGAVDKKASDIAKKDIDMKDYAKAAGVILGKLSLGEIKFLFDTASDEFWVDTPVEEIEKVRNIIFSKLTDSDISTLRQLGKKYGRSMTILNEDIDVAATKAKQVAKKQAEK